MLDDITIEDDTPALAVDSVVTMAFDRSMRTKDVDGHLHVEVVNISKANVCPYMGSEIPNGKELGLDPTKIYMLYRHPAELEAAAPTFENKQLMIQHVGVTATSPQEWLTVGVVSGVYWQAPYLKARLTVWNQKGIDAIESEAQKELSSGYRYYADMTPGTCDGVHYDGIMRGIKGNHVALVTEGRVGPDVFVTDEFPKEMYMKLSTLTAALAAANLIATDKKPEDVTRVLAEAIATDKKAKDEADKAAADKAAEDAAKIEAEDMAARDAAAKDAKCEPKDMVKGEDGKWVKDGKKGKDEDPDMDLSEDDLANADPSKGRKPEGGAPNPAQDQAAQDAAIKLAVDAAVASRDALHSAREEVKPLLGVVAPALDSAEAVYGAALDHLSVDYKGVDKSAYRALFLASIKKPDSSVTGDAKTVKTMDQAFPNLNRLVR